MTYKSFLLVITCSMAISACGGGGGGGSSDSGTTPPATQNKTFTISLDSVDITRTSNQERIAVDTSQVVTEELIYSP